MQYFFFLSLSLTLLLASQHVAAICPGFNYGVGNAQDQGKLGNSEVTRCMSTPSSIITALKYVYMNSQTSTLLLGNVYDDGCNVVDSLTTTTNPCDSGTFSCTGSPITFNGYTNSFNGQQLVPFPSFSFFFFS